MIALECIRNQQLQELKTNAAYYIKLTFLSRTVSMVSLNTVSKSE